MPRRLPASSARTSHPTGLRVENIHLALQLWLLQALAILRGERVIVNRRQGAGMDPALSVAGTGLTQAGAQSGSAADTSAL